MTRQFNEVCVQNMSSLEVLRLNVNNEHSMFVYSIRNQSFANMLIIFVPLVEIVLFTFFFLEIQGNLPKAAFYYGMAFQFRPHLREASVLHCLAPAEWGHHCLLTMSTHYLQSSQACLFNLSALPCFFPTRCYIIFHQ